ncbi:hypothetical protein ANCCAN_25239 [Ancylostoma caninum]|uniref:Uncharacterized protein n=1 Tax=Ancylostoma caninum TaxID=29170 RepID=A0A368FA39_ANCCA|nr:hypothetical protein ANCCAN_25239 [Ancylostoma caninum]
MRELSTVKSQFSCLKKEIEITRKLSRTNWLIIFNMPLPFGMSKANALQQVMERCGYGKPEVDRDLVSTELMFMNKTSNTCNMSFYTMQGHHDHSLGAVFQKRIMELNQGLPRGMFNKLTTLPMLL